MDLNKTGKRAYKCALKRGKITEASEKDIIHDETVTTIGDELEELHRASETEQSEHLDGITEAVEELVDVLIATLTELHRRNVDIEDVVHRKLKYNERR